MKKELVYDDISLFSRQVSSIKSRFSNEIKLSNQVWFGKEFIDIGLLMSAPMLDVSGVDLCKFLSNNGHLGVLHRFMDAEEQKESIKSIAFDNRNVISFSVGIHDCKEKMEHLTGVLNYFTGKNFIICIDTANGASELLEEPLKFLNKFCKAFPQHNFRIMAGNIVTKEAAQWLYERGVSMVRVGIGGGSVCTTPLATGIFRPLVSAIEEIAEWKRENGYSEFYIVADGGIKGAADVMKAVAVGADFVMLGSLFAGWDKSNGPIVGGKFKKYRGMASTEMAELNNQVNNITKKIVPEGVSSFVSYKGEIEPWFEQFIGSLNSSMSYCNARTLTEFRKNVEIVEITGAGNSLRQPHQISQ